MIPESSVTLDSILEGILDEEQSQSALSFTQSSSPSSSSMSSSPTDFLGLTSSPLHSSSSLAAAFPLDSISGVPCISIKTEIPDSCSLDIMMDYTEGESSCQDSPREIKLLDAMALMSGHDVNHASPTSSKAGVSILPLSPPSPERQHCSSTTQLADHKTGVSINDSAKDDDSPKRTCLVCGDVASGFHYGVSSCEACKAFFKRTIQGSIDYNCPASSDCEINKRRRKACQACRFQKCLRVGMLKEGVRLDRVRGGRQKYRRVIDNPYGSIHHAISRTSLEDNRMLNVLKKCEPEALKTMMPSPDTHDDELKIIAILSDLFDKELVATIGWAKQIPGFSDLTLNDQMRLLQGSWSEILSLSLCYRSLPSITRRLLFAHDLALSEQEAKTCGLSEFFSHCTHLVSRMESIEIRREEYLFLKGIVITNCDVVLDGSTELKNLRENLLTSLFECVSVIRSGNPGIHVQNLMLLLPAVRQADSILRKFWVEIKRRGKVNLNKLLVEMLEVTHDHWKK